MPVTLSAADRFVGFAISIIAMQFGKNPIMTDPRAINALRIAFGLSIIFQFAASLYIWKRIMAKNDQNLLKYKPEASLFSTGNEGEIETTVRNYDISEINKTLKALAFQTVALLAVHAKWNVTQPLFIQSFGFLRQVFFSPLYRAYIYGMKIARPYEDNMLFEGSSQEPTEVVVEVEPEVSTTEKRKKKED
ncbi:hypothetical protein PAEPH01_0823 [Pancytospora epiphaga]|nr:hypothetical protein PAEPH01_0823 [Pancytospora epiphaga]